MKRLSGIQLWFLLLYAWFIYFMWVPDMVGIYPSAQRYNIVFFQITNHLFQNNLNILFLSQWFEMLPLWYTKFSSIFGIVLGFLYCSTSLCVYSCIRNTPFWSYSFYSIFKHLVRDSLPLLFCLCVCVCLLFAHVCFTIWTLSPVWRHNVLISPATVKQYQYEQNAHT